MKEILFKLLRAELQGVSPEILLTEKELEILKVPGTEELLYAITAPHDLAHLVGASLARLDLPRDTDAAKKFRYAQIFAVQRYENIKYELQSLYGFFEDISVQYIPLKGTVLRQFYPKPEQRTSCDIDLLVAPEDLERTVTALEQKLSYRKTHAGSHDVALISPAGINLELHFTLIEKNDYPEIAGILEKVWENALPGTEYPHRYEMPGAYEYFYHIAHMVKHYLYGGCGIRTFMDLWIYQHHRPGFHRADASSLLEKGGIAVFEEKAVMLSERWFSGAEASDSALLDRMEAYILDGGIYGTANNRVKVSRADEKNKVQHILSRLFLSYDDLKYKYPILQKHPGLTLFCQVHRWGRLLSAGTSKRVIRELKFNNEFTEEGQQAMRTMLTELGLK